MDPNDMPYLIITEDGQVYRVKGVDVEQEMFQQVDDGTMTILDVVNMLEYHDGQWFDITEWGK